MVKLVISPQTITRALALAVLCITFAAVVVRFIVHYTGHDNLFGFVRQFDLNEEATLPQWYSSTALLLCASFLWTIASAKKANGDSYAVHWRALSLIFLFLAIDESAVLHEMLIIPLRKSALHPSGLFYYAWVIPYGALVLIILLALLRFLAHLPSKTRWLFVIAGTIYIGGAVGVEMIEGFYRSVYWTSKQNPLFEMLIIVEEFLEMTGIVMFVYALTSYMSHHVKDVQIHIADK